MMQKITFSPSDTRMSCRTCCVAGCAVPRACRARHDEAELNCKTNHVPKTEWKKRTRKHHRYIHPELSMCCCTAPTTRKTIWQRNAQNDKKSRTAHLPQQTYTHTTSWWSPLRAPPPPTDLQHRHTQRKLFSAFVLLISNACDVPTSFFFAKSSSRRLATVDLVPFLEKNHPRGGNF